MLMVMAVKQAVCLTLPAFSRMPAARGRNLARDYSSHLNLVDYKPTTRGFIRIQKYFWDTFRDHVQANSRDFCMQLDRVRLETSKT